MESQELIREERIKFNVQRYDNAKAGLGAGDLLSKNLGTMVLDFSPELGLGPSTVTSTSQVTYPLTLQQKFSTARKGGA